MCIAPVALAYHCFTQFSFHLIFSFFYLYYFLTASYPQLNFLTSLIFLLLCNIFFSYVLENAYKFSSTLSFYLL